MRGFLLAVWVLVPVVAGAFHYGPGQERLQLDDVQAYQAAGKRHSQQGDHEGAVKYFDEALARLPAGREAEAHRIRVERAKAMLLSQRLPEAYDDLTLLLDLLTPQEELDRANVFNIELLAGRLAEATRWVLARPDAAGCRVGYLGASTGAGAALWAAAEPGAEVGAIVSRGGRPDLAGDRLPAVEAVARYVPLLPVSNEPLARVGRPC